MDKNFNIRVRAILDKLEFKITFKYLFCSVGDFSSLFFRELSLSWSTSI